MKYVEFNFKVEDPILNRDILLAEISYLPFESFEETELGLKAFIPKLHLNRPQVHP